MDAVAPPSAPAQPSPPGAAAVFADAADWGVLEVAGADAAAFLQGQLSSDVASLSPGAGQWTSYNSPRGRMLANGFLWRHSAGDRYGLLLAAALAEPVRKRLAMFVLRSKVTIADATGSLARFGVAGPGAAATVAAFLGLAAPPASATAISAGSATAAGLPDGRWLVLVPAADGPATEAALARHATRVDPDAWRREGILAGIGIVGPATQDAFVAQTANWDAVGGISFRKGCYTGQEIIARTQYLGRLKERLFRFAAAAPPPAPGTRLYGAPFGDQPCGTVVDAAVSPGGSELLAVVQVAAVEAGALRLGAPDGPALAPAPLPYPIPEAVAPARPRL